MTWQDLKDFCRDPKDGQGPCDVEHAEVYRGGKNSKSRGYGYVKIRGEKDFWRVYSECLFEIRLLTRILTPLVL